jgi:DNA-binding response OmpR family regulator
VKSVTPNILLVEDQPDVIVAVSAALRSSGTVLVVNDLETALREVTALTFDLIVLDVSFEKPSSLRFYKLLKRDEVFRQIPVILTSGIHRLADEINGLRFWKPSNLAKPFYLPDLCMKVNSMMSAAARSAEIRNLGVMSGK